LFDAGENQAGMMPRMPPPSMERMRMGVAGFWLLVLAIERLRKGHSWSD